MLFQANYPSLTKAATSLGLGRESLVSVAVNENPGKDPTGNVLLCYLRVATNNSHFIHTVFSIYIVLMYTSIIAAFPYQALAFVSLEQRSGKALVSSSYNNGQNLLRQIAKMPIFSCHPGKN